MQTIAVLLGGESNERGVSLKSGQAVLDALDRNRYKVIAIDPRDDLARLIELAPVLDAALIMLHGRGGEDGSIQGLLDLLKIPYQCSGVLGCAIAMNKALSKDIYKQNNIPTAAGFVLSRQQRNNDLRPLLAACNWPLVVKPAHEGSSFGVSIVKSAEDLSPALQWAFTMDEIVLVEEFIHGLELTVAVIGNRRLEALPVIEIIPSQGEFFDFNAKYVAGKSQEICPARISPAQASAVQAMALQAHAALNLKGYSRSDFILSPQRGAIILETNTVPGMTANSLLPLAARSAGLSFAQLVEKLIALALGQE
jgi:D-alanine-D-alanine ligase